MSKVANLMPTSQSEKKPPTKQEFHDFKDFAASIDTNSDCTCHTGKCTCEEK